MRPGAALCHIQSVPAGSTTDPLQDTADPISQVCGASVKTYFKKEKEYQAESRVRGELKGRNSSADTKVREGAGGRGTPGARPEIPLQPTEEKTVKQVVPLQPVENHVGTDTHTVASG